MILHQQAKHHKTELCPQECHSRV